MRDDTMTPTIREIVEHVGDQMSEFLECVNACMNNAEFVSHWERLHGVKVVRAVDDACGYDHGSKIAELFISDVYDLVWLRLDRGTE